MANMEYYTDQSFYNGGFWLKQDKRDELIRNGYTPCNWNKNTFVKETKVPAYSSQIEGNKIKHIGDEPRPVNYSIHDHQYETSYYEVRREDFEGMANKPALSQVYRPLRLHNFDGFVDKTQTERKGEGWTETYQRDYHTTITYKFFIVD